MAEIKLNLNSNDKIKALLGDLNVEIEVPASAFFDFVKGQMTLQDVTNNGAGTTASISVNSIAVSAGVVFQSGTLIDIKPAPSKAITPDVIIELTINSVVYQIAAQIKT
jgi:hypothetical protein